MGATVRAAAQSASRAGWNVYGVDLYGDVDTQAACVESVRVPLQEPSPDGQCPNGPSPDGHPGQLSEAATRWAGLGVPWLWVGHVDHPEISKWFPQDSKVPSIGKDPHCLKRFSQACGLVPVESHETYSDCPSWGPWLIKPRRGSGGLGIRRITPGATEAIDPTNYFVQAEAKGTPIGATCLADADHVRVVGFCQSLTRGGNHRPYAYAGSIGPTEVSDAMRSSFESIAQEFVRQHSFRGLFNIDAIIEPLGRHSVEADSRDGKSVDRLRLLEINPRMGASTELIERGFGISLVDLAIRIRLGESIDWGVIPDNVTMVYRKQIRYAAQSMAYQHRDMVKQYGPEAEICDRPREGQWHQAGEPLCTVIEPVCQTT